MPRRCVVIGCPNANNRQSKKHLFGFPEYVAAKWIEATGRKNWTPGVTSAICEIHFKPEDFSNSVLRRRLKPDVIPTQNLFAASMTDTQIEEARTSQPKQDGDIQEKDDKTYLEPVNTVTKRMSVNQRKMKTSYVLAKVKLKIRKLEKENNLLQDLIRSLKKKCRNELQTQGNVLKHIIQRQQKQYEQKLAIKNKQLKIFRIQIKRKDDKINDLLMKEKGKSWPIPE